MKTHRVVIVSPHFPPSTVNLKIVKVDAWSLGICRPLGLNIAWDKPSPPVPSSIYVRAVRAP